MNILISINNYYMYYYYLNSSSLSTGHTLVLSNSSSLGFLLEAGQRRCGQNTLDSVSTITIGVQRTGTICSAVTTGEMWYSLDANDLNNSTLDMLKLCIILFFYHSFPNINKSIDIQNFRHSKMRIQEFAQKFMAKFTA